jgi:hypothetical protein
VDVRIASGLGIRRILPPVSQLAQLLHSSRRYAFLPRCPSTPPPPPAGGGRGPPPPAPLLPLERPYCHVLTSRHHPTRSLRHATANSLAAGFAGGCALSGSSAPPPPRCWRTQWVSQCRGAGAQPPIQSATAARACTDSWVPAQGPRLTGPPARLSSCSAASCSWRARAVPHALIDLPHAPNVAPTAGQAASFRINFCCMSLKRLSSSGMTMCRATAGRGCASSLLVTPSGRPPLYSARIVMADRLL